MKAFEVIRLQPGQSVGAPGATFGGELRPIRLWVLPHGSIKNKPSFIWEMVDIFGNTYIAQISEEMLSTGLIEADEMKLLSEH